MFFLWSLNGWINPLMDWKIVLIRWYVVGLKGEPMKCEFSIFGELLPDDMSTCTNEFIDFLMIRDAPTEGADWNKQSKSTRKKFN